LRLLVLLLAGGSLPTTALAWWNADWAYRKEIIVQAPAEMAPGAQIANVPLLLRLHEGVLPFQDAAVDGSDLRFVAGDDKTPLRFHIEKFDSAFGMAFVWVQLPQLDAGVPQTIWLYYGNPDASTASDAARTYDASQTLVYHFNEVGAPAADSTAFANTAVGLYTAEEGGLVGSAARFDGLSLIELPASPSLGVTEGGSLTLSLWLKPDADASDAVLYAQRDITGSLELGLAGGYPYVELIDALGEVYRSDPAAVPLATDWHHLALVAGEGSIGLFIDGEPAAALAAQLPALGSAATLGGRRSDADSPVEAGFAGIVDEFQLAKTAHTDAMLRVAAINQGPSDGMVSFGADEGQSQGGYMVIILGSLTFDGWVVIVICILMMVISWYVMWIKGVQVRQVARSNALFMELYRAAQGDFIGLEKTTARDAKAGKLSPRQRVLLQRSPLLHIFRDGVEEMRQRLAVDNNGDLRGYLSPQSIEAIRATVDSRLVRENQSLGNMMVLLTIAISGGPFIGLLGTVIGVMITFAGVAAAGDVNVNAIAPGVSAALAATVAGLGVAIPALFGYNYLVTRNKETLAEMQVFVDAIVTRIAESFSSRDAAH
jgi:biopolymer transport protein ExbB